jgi:hypothetical protein
MRIAVAFVVLLVSASSVQADPSTRAMAVADALTIDPTTADKLIDILVKYDAELTRLQRQRIEIKRRLVLARHEHPRDVEIVLDDVIGNQRAFVANEETLVRRARKILGARRAAELLVLINATEPARVDETAPALAVSPEPARRTAYDPNVLFPPRSPCNPFESMHGCAVR